MLTDTEVTYFRNRIDDVLQMGRMSKWQRGFLLDMRAKIERYGARTRFSEKQFSTLKRLTAIKGDTNLRLAVSNRTPRTRHHRWHWAMSHREQKLLFMAAVMVVVLIASLSRQIVDNMSFSFPSMSTSEAFQARNYSVTDGDTIRMDDGTRVRLIYRGDMTQAGCDWRITETLSMTS